MIKELTNIGREEIHVWTGIFDLHDEATRQMKTILSPREVTRVEALRFRDDQVRYIQSHTILRSILSWYLGIDPGNIDFEFGVYGKPCLKGTHKIAFNISHTKDMIAVAISKTGDIGIDIERQDDVKDMEDVAGQFMSNEEFRSMRKIAQNLRRNYFYLCWVRKEALLKAEGIGLNDHLRQISVIKDRTRNDSKHIEGFIKGEKSVWWLNTFELAKNHIGAVCIANALEKKDYSIQFQNVNLLNLRV